MWVDILIDINVVGRRRFIDDQNLDLLDLTGIVYDICDIGENWIVSVRRPSMVFHRERRIPKND